MSQPKFRLTLLQILALVISWSCIFSTLVSTAVAMPTEINPRGIGGTKDGEIRLGRSYTDDLTAALLTASLDLSRQKGNEAGVGIGLGKGPNAIGYGKPQKAVGIGKGEKTAIAAAALSGDADGKDDQHKLSIFIKNWDR